ncbi:hypothetical protein S7S_05455 [Isoalcanivorax pacificus W11-5]|uniref:Uncharacterized protein n=1 Tax=Isoalcanivorax pacificus W11-5 TaxID=391936 RepID=A0A0B4XKA0_9GAMM|nr:hypothetical protein [Isoalcanivorax pacificus]AJD47511.1 hypothetical protein S7S_05455 [Isoalcanivorax pacificus W11-5]
MTAILAGVVLLGWGALAAARALLRLRGLDDPALMQLGVPAGVWLLCAGVLLIGLPETTLIDGGHTPTLVWSLVLITLICAVSPMLFWLRQRGYFR